MALYLMKMDSGTEEWFEKNKIFNKYRLFFHMLMHDLKYDTSDGDEESEDDEKATKEDLININVWSRIIAHPVDYIMDEGGKKSTTTLLKIYPSINMWENVYEAHKLDSIGNTQTNKKMIFNTDTVIRGPSSDNIKRYYTRLLEFIKLNGAKHYFDKVAYFGQGSSTKIPDGEPSIGGDNYRWSENTKGRVNGEIYEVGKTVVRYW